MAHPAQNKFFQMVRDAHPEFFEWSSVLEVGSLNINGSLRDLFRYCNYVGLDIGSGPGVDYAVAGQDAKYRDGSFDITISAECFEHNPYWKETFLNMVRMTRPGGIIVFTCAGRGRPEHGTSRSDTGSSPLTVAAGWDYYMNLEPHHFSDCLNDISECIFYENIVAQDLYFVGRRGGVLNNINLESVNWHQWD